MQRAAPTCCCLPASVEEKDRFLLLFFVQERCCHIVSLTSCGHCNKHWNATVQRLFAPPPTCRHPDFCQAFQAQVSSQWLLPTECEERHKACSVTSWACFVYSQWETGNEHMKFPTPRNTFSLGENYSSSTSQEIPHIL